MRAEAALSVRALFGAHFFILLWLCTGGAHVRAQAGADCRAPGSGQWAIVRSVHDGDTLTLADDRRVRLIGINAPELGRDGSPAQPFARAARDRLRELLPDRTPVRLVLGAERRDWLAHVYQADGSSVEAALLRQGLAWHIAVPPNLSQAECLAAAEAQARRRELGLWGPNGIAPVPAQRVRRGGYQRVRGIVERVDFRRSWWLDLKGNVAGVIRPRHQHRFTRAALDALAGKEIELQGWVYENRGDAGKPWRVNIETPYALMEPGGR